MANLSFDFNKIKRTFFNVRLKNGQDIQVKMPKKSTFEKVKALMDLENDSEADFLDVADTFAAVMAECINNNLNGVKVTTEELADEYDIDEMIMFITGYFESFVKSLNSNPN